MRIRYLCICLVFGVSSITSWVQPSFSAGQLRTRLALASNVMNPHSDNEPNRTMYQRIGDPALGYSLVELETLLQDRAAGDRETNGTGASTLEDDKNGGVYLDTDAYLQASQEWLLSDGSLSQIPAGDDDTAYRRAVEQILQPAPMSPDATAYPSQASKDEPDRGDAGVQDLLQAIKDLRERPVDMGAGKALHEEVFRQEQAYLKQSQLFRDSLFDSSLSRKARVARHSQEYRERLQRAQEQLYQEMDDFTVPEADTVCQVCGCNCSPVEIERGNGICSLCHVQAGLPTRGPQPGRSKKRPSRELHSSDEGAMASPSASWVKMEDPDTGEVFYWNEATEEMRWELDP